MATIPVNISANVGVSGGAPNDPETTAQYLTQLQQSLNGFTGSTAAALNYLLGVVATTPVQKTVRIAFFEGASGGNYTLPAAGGYVMGGMSYTDGSGNRVSGSSGWLGEPLYFTPAATGRVALFSALTWQPGMLTAGNSGSCNAILEYGTGGFGSAPAQGAAAPVGTQVGLGSIVELTMGQSIPSGGFFLLGPMALISGLSTTTTYWADIGFSVSLSSSGIGGVIVQSGFVIVFEC